MSKHAPWAKVARYLGIVGSSDKNTLGNVPPPSLPFWLELSRLIQRRWFSRLWVLQEVLLAVSVVFQCGRKTFSPALLYPFVTPYILREWPVHLVEADHEYAASFNHTAQMVYDLLQHQKTGNTGENTNVGAVGRFARLSCKTRRRNVTLPVDRVWALLGLAPESIQQEASSFIDYKKPAMASHHAVYARFARVLLSDDPFLTLLSYVSSGDQVTSLPSWCPDFNSPGRQSGALDEYPTFHAGYDYRNAGPQGPRPVPSSLIHFPIDSAMLQVYGCHIDQIRNVIAPINLAGSKSDPKLNIAIFAAEAARAALAQETYGMCNDVPDAHWRTLVTDHMLAERCVDQHRDDYGQFRELLNRWAHPSEQSSDALPSAPELKRYRRRAFYTMGKLHYFSTRDGRIGTAVSQVEEGDVICIFQGAASPFVVRYKVSAHDGRPKIHLDEPGRLLGPAYVHGLMDGEVFSLPRKEWFITLK